MLTLRLISPMNPLSRMAMVAFLASAVAATGCGEDSKSGGGGGGEGAGGEVGAGNPGGGAGLGGAGGPGGGGPQWGGDEGGGDEVPGEGGAEGNEGAEGVGWAPTGGEEGEGWGHEGGDEGQGDWGGGEGEGEGGWECEAGGEGGEGGGGGQVVGIAPPGAQDFAEFKRALDRGRIPNISSLDATGFINEHKIDLPAPDCGDTICLHGMLGVMPNLLNGANCTMLMLGLNARLSDEQLERKPLNLTIAIDISGSMRAEGKIEFARQGLQLLLENLHDDDTITIVTYASSARVLAEAVGRAGWEDLSADIGRLSVGGGTNLYEGLDLAFDMTRRYQRGDVQNRVILVSDGEPTVGITNQGEIFELARTYAVEGIALTTVGMGDEFNPELMRGLAEVGAGNHYFLGNVQDVREVFVEEIEYFVTPVATNLQIELVAGGAYGMREVFGTSMVDEIQGDRTVIRFPAVNIAHRVAHDDQAQGRRGGGGALMVELTPHRGWGDLEGIDLSEVTTMRLTYTPAGEVLSVENEQVVEYPFDPDAMQDGGFFSVNGQENDTAAVEKGFVMMNIFVGFRMATERANRGDVNSALVVLDDLDTGVSEWLRSNRDLDIVDDQLWLLRYKEVLVSAGARRPDDDPPAEDPWPVD